MKIPLAGRGVVESRTYCGSVGKADPPSDFRAISVTAEFFTADEETLTLITPVMDEPTLVSPLPFILTVFGVPTLRCVCGSTSTMVTLPVKFVHVNVSEL